MTVFMIGIFDSFFFTVMLSVTNHGEISSRLVLAWKLISVFCISKNEIVIFHPFFCQIEFLLGGQSVQINTITINSPCCCWCSWLFRCCWWGLSCCRWWAAASPRCCSSCCSTSSCCSQSWTWTGWWLQKHGDYNLCYSRQRIWFCYPSNSCYSLSWIWTGGWVSGWLRQKRSWDSGWLLAPEWAPVKDEEERQFWNIWETRR